MKFRCCSCEKVLTRELKNTPVSLCEEDGKDLLPEGFTLQDDEWSEGQWVINSKDNLSMKITNNPKRLNGCCDLDGCDGPNLVCESCGAEVATAKYDCWMPKYIMLSKVGAVAIT